MEFETLLHELEALVAEELFLLGQQVEDSLSHAEAIRLDEVTGFLERAASALAARSPGAHHLHRT